jgi:hypothetical protein
MTLALEINDVGLVLVRDGEIVAEEPGCAMLDGRTVETGSSALRRARLKPLYAETRHWQDLGTAALPRPMPAAATYADVAYAQLAALAEGLPGGARDTLLAVPGGYGREQLAVLLGVAREAGLEVVGLVDAGLAAAALEPVPESVLQLELATHQSVLTVLEHAGELRRSGCELLPRHGWMALQQAWLDMVAAAFVRRTRFDPLHEAASEQRLWDALPGWLAALERDPVVTVDAVAAGETLTVELSRGDFAAAAAATYDAVLQALQRARPARGPLQLRLSQRWAGLPGFAERLAGLIPQPWAPAPGVPDQAAGSGVVDFAVAGSTVKVRTLSMPRSGTSRCLPRKYMPWACGPSWRSVRGPLPSTLIEKPGVAGRPASSSRTVEVVPSL